MDIMNNRELGNARRRGLIGTYEGIVTTNTGVNFWHPLETIAYSAAELTDDAIILGNIRIPKEIFIEAYNKWIGEELI